MLTGKDQELRDARAKLREYAILEAKILILLHNQGDQDSDVLATKLGFKDEVEAKRPFRLALGSLANKELIEPSTTVVPGLTLVKELKPPSANP